ncbi:calcium-binding protein [Variovorax rhizosphaerae]|uniref:Calcium-binding protein n=1 Tax=Variovorax rhizosphaerae TaxID=1836200 RepID=A0ABU8WQ57_9BURK
MQFKAGVAVSDVTLGTSGAAVIIKINGTTDQITFANVLYQDNVANAYNPLQQIRSADGTTWDLAAIQAKLYAGSEAADTLIGTLNAETINGLGGNDYLYGKAGNDTYLFSRGYGVDTVTENDATTGNTDVAQFGADIATDQLWFRQVGNNLEVSLIGTDDKLTLSNWYLGSQYHVEQFKTSDGHTLLDSQVQNLVSAMAGFAPPAAGQTTLPANYASSLAANWQ